MPSNICTRCAVWLSPTSIWKKASNTPVRLSRQNRFQTLFQRPYSAGSARLENLVDLRRPLVCLAKLIDWGRFEAECGPLYTETSGRPGLPMRLMVGLHLLKHMDDRSWHQKDPAARHQEQLRR